MIKKNKLISFLYNFFLLLIIFFVVLVDFLSKKFILKKIQNFQLIRCTFFLNLIKSKNYGFMFGAFSGINSFMKNLFIFISSFFFLISYCFLFKINKKFFYDIFFSLIFGGILGNFLDRLINGFVVDFIDFHIMENHFPVFNISDFFIFFGFFALLIMNIFRI